jgi:hypothetical protein
LVKRRRRGIRSPVRGSIASAGYKLTGLLSTHRGEAFTSSAARPEYLDGLKKRIARRGLAVNLTAIRFRPDAALAASCGRGSRARNSMKKSSRPISCFG